MIFYLDILYPVAT